MTSLTPSTPLPFVLSDVEAQVGETPLDLAQGERPMEKRT
jgi:hypothetical protein